MQFPPVRVGTIPPVRQLAPNLAGQNRFLSSSPGNNITSQLTAFPGAGGGSNFLTVSPAKSPRVKGYMDTRLEMMGSTSILGPSGAFPAGVGAGGPQFEDASLQQSIAQHNEAQRGSSTVRIPWALSKQERKQYDQIFRAWDPTASGFLDGKKSLEVFSANGLDQSNLAKIWYELSGFICNCACSLSRTGCSPIRLTEGNSTERNSMSQWVSSTAVHPFILPMKLTDLPQLSTAILSRKSFLQNSCLPRKRISTSPLISFVISLRMRRTIVQPMVESFPNQSARTARSTATMLMTRARTERSISTMMTKTSLF